MFGADMALRQIPTGLFAKIKFCQGSLPYVYRITPDRAQTFNASLVAIPGGSLPWDQESGGCAYSLGGMIFALRKS